MSPPLSIERAAVVEDLLFLHGDVSGERLTQVVVCDEAGTPQRASLISTGPGTPVRLGEGLAWISERGVHHLRETDDVAGYPGFEIGRFQPFDFGVPIQAAASLVDGALVAGFSGDGRLALRRFDGLSVLSVPGVPEIQGGIAVAIAGSPEGATVGVVAESSLQVLRYSAESGSLTAEDPIAVDGVPVAVFASRSGWDGSPDVVGDRSMWSESLLALVERPSGVIALRIDPESSSTKEVDLGAVDGLDGDIVPIGMALGSGGRSTPLLSIDGLPAALGFAESGGLATVAAPVSIATWLALRARFALPMSLHLFILVAMTFIWRRPVRRAPMVMGPDGKGYEVLLPFAAPVRRAGALIIDTLIAVVVGTFLCQFAFLPAEYFLLQRSMEAMTAAIQTEAPVVPPVTVIATALIKDVSAAMLFLVTGMCAFMEAFRGQTLGKRLLGIHTVCRDGTAINPGSAAARAMLLIVDVFPLGFSPPMPILGTTLVLFTKRKMRLGDLAAGTVVIDPRKGQRTGPGNVRFKVKPGGGLADSIPTTKDGDSAQSPPDKVEPGDR